MGKTKIAKVMAQAQGTGLIRLQCHEKELTIVHSKVPRIDTTLAEQICRFMEQVRQQKLEKVPG